jgi:hypothetical protein
MARPAHRDDLGRPQGPFEQSPKGGERGSGGGAEVTTGVRDWGRGEADGVWRAFFQKLSGTQVGFCNPKGFLNRRHPSRRFSCRLCAFSPRAGRPTCGALRRRQSPHPPPSCTSPASAFPSPSPEKAPTCRPLGPSCDASRGVGWKTGENRLFTGKTRIFRCFRRHPPFHNVSISPVHRRSGCITVPRSVEPLKALRSELAPPTPPHSLDAQGVGSTWQGLFQTATSSSHDIRHPQPSPSEAKQVSCKVNCIRCKTNIE